MNPFLRARYLVESVAIRATLAVVDRAPLGAVLGLANVVSRGVFFAWRERRRIATENVLRAGICDTEREARRIALASFRTFVAMVAEVALARRRMTVDNWQDYVKLVIGPEAEELVRTPGKGLIVASAHLGNWEIVARVASMLKPTTAIYRPLENPYLQDTVAANREGENLTLIAKYEDDPMRFIRTLTDGEMLAIMIDQHARNGLPVEFFGRTALTTPTVAMLHLVTRAPIVLAFSIRTGPLAYEAHAVGPFEFERSGDREKDVFEITQSLTSEIEKIARQYPEQYMWGHRRWK